MSAVIERSKHIKEMRDWIMRDGDWLWYDPTDSLRKRWAETLESLIIPEPISNDLTNINDVLTTKPQNTPV